MELSAGASRSGKWGSGQWQVGRESRTRGHADIPLSSKNGFTLQIPEYSFIYYGYTISLSGEDRQNRPTLFLDHRQRMGAKKQSQLHRPGDLFLPRSAPQYKTVIL